MIVNDALKKYSLVVNRYESKGNVYIVDTNKGKFVYKDGKINKDIFVYLMSRNFDYFPNFVNRWDDNFQITEFMDDFDIPAEQKILDMITLVSLLHNKTTHYKEIDSEEYEQLYDDLNNNIIYLYTYYTDLINIIESKVYMSPCEYLLARNIYVIYDTLDECSQRLEKWYKRVNEKRKQRRVVLHNNLKLDHFIRNNNSYLISWDKSRIGSPVFDLYKLYLNHALDFDFCEIFKLYEKKYPLFEDEKELLFILISLPKIITFNNDEYTNTFNTYEMLERIYKTNEFTKKV